MHLWELSLESIPLAWQESYDEALKTAPNGELVDLPDDQSYYTNLLACKALLEIHFNHLKNEAQNIYKRLTTDKDICRLLEIDICLYGIISYWICEEHDYSSFNPDNIEHEIHDLNSYFSQCIDNMKKYDCMKFIRLSKPYLID